MPWELMRHATDTAKLRTRVQCTPHRILPAADTNTVRHVDLLVDRTRLLRILGAVASANANADAHTPERNRHIRPDHGKKKNTNEN
jgi:hypothetical protein